MPETKGRPVDIKRKDFKIGREEARKNVEAFLDERGIKHERVMDFVCFKYKGQEHRAKQVLEAKTAMGLF